MDIQLYQSMSDLPAVVCQLIKTADAETLPRWSECVLIARTRMGERTARTARYCAWLTVVGAVEGGKGTWRDDPSRFRLTPACALAL